MVRNSLQRRPRREKPRDHDDAARARRQCGLRARIALLAGLLAVLAAFVSTVLRALLVAPSHNHGGSALTLISWVTSTTAVTALCIVHYYLAKTAALAGRRHWLITIAQSVAAIVRRGSGEREDCLLRATGLRILTLAAVGLPRDLRADTLATVRDVLYEATGAAPTRCAVSAVVLRLLGGMLTKAVRARKRYLVGAGGGSVVTLGVTSNVQSLLGLHLNLLVGAGLVVISMTLGAVIGGWVAGIAERRVP